MKTGPHITQPGVKETFIQINGNGLNYTGLLRGVKGLPIRIYYRRFHVVSRRNKENMVFYGTRFHQSVISAPNRHEDDFGPVSSQSPCGIGVLKIPTDHHTDLAEICLKYG